MKRIVAGVVGVLGVLLVLVAGNEVFRLVFGPATQEPVAQVAPIEVAPAPVAPAPVAPAQEPVVAQAPVPVQPEPAPEPEPEPEPVRPTTPDITLAQVQDARADAILRRQQAEDDVLLAEIADHQRRVDTALLPAADAYFDDVHREQAAALRSDCAAQDQSACAALAALYEKGTGTWQDESLAFSLNFFACRAGVDAGCIAFSENRIIQTYPYEGSSPQVAHFTRRCDEDDGDSCTRLAVLHSSFAYSSLREEKETEFTEETANALYEKACALGTARACDQLGDTQRSKALYEAACNAGDGGACYGAAGMNKDAAFVYLERGCALESASVCRELGRRYLEGDGVGADDAKATAYFVQSCELGSMSGCMHAAKRYEAGLGTAVDLQAAAGFFTLVCEDGFGDTTACQGEARMRRKMVDLGGDDVHAALGQDADTLAAIAACGAADASACLTLAQLHRLQLTPESRGIAAALIERACRDGEIAACIQHLRAVPHDAATTLAQDLCSAGVADGCVWGILSDHDGEAATRAQALQDYCNMGSGTACTQLGQLYLPQNGRPSIALETDRQLAQLLLEMGCNKGDGMGCTSASWAYDPQNAEDYPDVTSDAAKTLILLEKGCALGGRGSCGQLAYGYERFEGQAENAPEIYEAERNGCRINGECDGFQRVEIYRERDALRAEHGVLQSALLDRNDDFHPAFQAEARRLRGGCLGDATADCIALGDLFYAHQDATKRTDSEYAVGDRTWARALYLHACEQGDGRGCGTYADAHEYIGDDSEPEVALAYHAKGCALGYGLSCHQLGTAFERGWDVAEDHEKAAEYYNKGCDFGFVYSCQAMGGLYDIADVNAQMTHRIRACVTGRTLDCEFAGRDFYRGDGDVPQDKAIGRVLLQYGCDDGDADVCDMLARFEGE